MLSLSGEFQIFGNEPRRDELIILTQARDDPTNQIFVFFPDDERVGIKTIGDYVKRMKNDNVDRALMVVRSSLTPHAKQSLTRMENNFRIEQFLVNHFRSTRRLDCA